MSPWGSDTALLGRAAAVVRNRRYVRDAGDLEPDRVQRTNRGFAARAGTLDAHFQILYAAFLRRPASLFGRYLGCEGSRLARTLETRGAGCCPGQCVSLTVGDRH